MHDPIDPRNEAAQPSTEPRTPAQAEPQATDREVPLDSRELPQAVHAWLDGESVPESTLSGAEREVALWKEINAEAGRRRRMTTPAHVPVQILAKLADD
ncbi:MAG: hypothetical protein KF689_12580 [Gemmatimonadaceae bacterium]|nr:hypothetical protein [Gemmatimonadaceae bacterium]MCW5827182.1 hypothetical protein [Gemmatimonadaceae bacterium]